MKISKNKWLSCFNPNEGACVNIVCFPYGGAGASVYKSWVNLFPASVQVWAIQLPGRENRFREPFEVDSKVAFHKIVEEIEYLGLKNIVFFGHSMGSDMALSVTCLMHEMSKKLPQLLIVSGNKPPCIPHLNLWANAPENKLMTHVVSLGGIPPEILQDREFATLYLEKIRADYKLYESIPSSEATKLNLPIVVICCPDDPLLEGIDMTLWSRYAGNEIDYITLEGGHFYLQSKSMELAQIIKNAMKKCIFPC